MIKLVITDLDGTLVTFQDVPDPKLPDFLRVAKKHHVPICVATGRCEHDAYTLFKAEDGIFLNGSIVKKEGEIVYSCPVYAPSVDRLVDYCIEHNICVGYYDDKYILTMEEKDQNFLEYSLEFWQQDNGAQTEEFFREYIFAVDPQQVKQTVIYKVEIFIPDKEKNERCFQFAKSLPNVEVCRSHWTTIEVNGKGVNKGLACRKIAEAYGLKDDEVVVCGDGGNDLAMMKEFPITLAPAGAEDKIKEAAWEVCASVEEGGICGRLIEMIEEGQ